MSDITRRDFINGALLTAGGAVLPFGDKALAMATLDPTYYPPALTGLRGSHPGSNDHAHARAWSEKSDWGSTQNLSEDYDLVVVGGGISGLAAAYFYRQQHGNDKKVLVLDNHDDFGGHAKRNEHTIDGKTLISYGGSQTIVEPRHADETVQSMFDDIGIDIQRFEAAYDREFYSRHNLSAATYFNAEVFGENKVVRHAMCNYPNYIEGLPTRAISNEDAAKQVPLTSAGKKQLLRVLNGGLHCLDVPDDQLDDYIKSHSYYDYLRDTLGVDDPLIMRMARHTGLDWAGTGTDLMSIASAKRTGAMGFTPVEVFDEDNPYIHHFPDGNAGLARALVKKLIPAVAPGTTAEDLVLAKFRYDKLDRPGNTVRVRLNSTAVDVAHLGDPSSGSDVSVQYINDNTSYRVRAKGVVMACYNMIVPHIVSGLPDEQAAALRLQNKSPLQYTTVGLRNWRAFKELGIGMAMSPGNMHQAVLMDFPVSMGGYEFTKSPDEPCVIQMISCPYGEVGAPRLEQFRQARYRMLALQFSDYEKEVRRHLAGMLPAELFDFDRDVASISVNRWAHGYTASGPDDSVEVGRQPFGRITIANTDSSAGSDAKNAIMMAHRAVNELG